MGQLINRINASSTTANVLLRNTLNYGVTNPAFQNELITPGSATLNNASRAQPKVAILLCTCDGQRYLTEQLDSFATQSHTNWKLWVSDDASKDSTRAILENYRQKWSENRLSIYPGPVKGFAANFLSLVCKADIKADYYAYSDQDDIWEVDKLERAVAQLKTVPRNIPALYCSRTRLVDKDNNEIGLSPLFSKSPSFANALTQNIGGGNTMVFNHAARKLICNAGKNLPIVSHDWWAYMVVSGCGGQVFYDSKPTLRYRQHDKNLFGANISWSARFKRSQMLWQGYFRQWNSNNITALRALESKLTPENRKILERFAQAREMHLIPRLFNLKRCNIHRQTLLGNLGLVTAAIFNKL